jgi:CHAD domain-containing protein
MASDRSSRPERTLGAVEESLETVPAARPAKRPSLGGKLRLPRRRPLREGVLTAFARVLGAARRSARRAGDDPVAAVHVYRKSLRRARAVVSLLSSALGKPATKGLAGHLQRAFRATNAFRDADILLQTLHSVPVAPEDDLARHAIEVALELEQRRSLAETSETLARGLRALAALPAAMEVVLDPRFSAQDLERGLTRSRRRERRALERARETGSDDDLHEWRKRVKELRYQLELFASTGSLELKKREKALAELAQDLGDVTDLIVLKSEIARRQKEGTVPPAPALIDRMARLTALRSGEILERGARLFEDDPKLFARQVIGERG